MCLHLTLGVTVDATNSLGSPTEDTIEAVHRELNDPRASGALFGEQFSNIFGGEVHRSHKVLTVALRYSTHEYAAEK